MPVSHLAEDREKSQSRLFLVDSLENRGRRISTGRGFHSAYTHIMTTCIESSALVVTSSSLCVILEYALVGVKRGGEGDFMFRLLPHICVGV